MKLGCTKSKNSVTYYVQRTVRDGKKTVTKNVERLGTIETVKTRCGDMDPYVWMKQYVLELTAKEKEGKLPITIQFSAAKSVNRNSRRSVNIGYFVLQKLYYSLGLDKVCFHIQDKSKANFILNDILSALIYARIIFPGSKRSSLQQAEKFFEKPDCELHDVYRALSLLAENNDYFQAQLYKNSKEFIRRNTGVLYYDCTNYYFETEQEDDFRRYGCSKEHRPNPIVQMGLFMDSDGLPLSFSLFEGNRNEQTSMTPLERRIVSDFGIRNCVVCTDAGLSSAANRKFNNVPGRGYITTWSVKKLKGHLKDFCLGETGWRTEGKTKLYSLSEIDALAWNSQTVEQHEIYSSRIYYKEQWFKDDGMDQRIVITYSVKYKEYQKMLRNRQWERAEHIANSSSAISAVFEKNATSPKRFLKSKSYTSNGEPADKTEITLNYEQYEKEEQYDGLYCVCTNLEDDVSEIIRINQRRWEIEESFRILKSEFKARPVYLSRKERITAHFMVCFTALLIYRLLEKHLEQKYTCKEIITALREMNMLHLEQGYLPEYTPAQITDDLQKFMGGRTDFEIITKRNLNKICSLTKQRKNATNTA